jgi:hypothetical protein
MAEEQQKIEETAEECCQAGAKKKCFFAHKVFGLRGLSNIYKALSIFTVLFLAVLLISLWYATIKQGTPLQDSLLLSLQWMLYYGLVALVFITISRVLKVLKKIKHAVEHK